MVKKYQKINSHKMTEEELRQLWSDTYCNSGNPIITFDNIPVKFYSNMFDHAFYESANRQEKDKSILSLNRCQKMLWIKDTLEDQTATLKQGWDRNSKKYRNNRRVAFIKDNYVVIIKLRINMQAIFVTAYELQDDDNISKIKQSPDWDKEWRKKNAD